MEKALEVDMELVKTEMKSLKKDTLAMKQSSSEQTQLLKETQSRVDQLESHISKIQEDEIRQKLTDENTEVCSSEEDAYLKRKERLKDDLATFYLERHSAIPLSPLFEEKETLLEEFYIMPQMQSIDIQNTFSRGAESKTPVNSLSELFKSDKEFTREIYLIANAGLGKTVFSKYLTATWCQAHRPNGRAFEEDHLKALSEFELLFLVSLREASDVCNIDDMIKLQIVQHLAFSSLLSNEHLQEILHREKCLVILDGLDEWTHPNKNCTKSPKNVPRRIAREKCMILTTTRPWKLSVINLRTSQIDKKIELVKLDIDSALKLQINAFWKLNPEIDDEQLLRQIIEFNKEITDCDLKDLSSVPLLLIYLISLWCDHIPLGQPMFGLYCSIIELLLSRTVTKYPGLQLTCEDAENVIPQFLSEHEYCKKYYSLLKALGRLTFHTLFSETKENTLVFDSSVAEKYLGRNDLKMSLLSGILTQSKVQVKLTKQSTKISFSHKSVQEYFSALYISCQDDSDLEKTILKGCKNIQNILDMSAFLVFVSGINAKLISSISHDLMSLISEDTITGTYMSLTGYHHYQYAVPLKDIQNMYISCINENPDNNDIKLCLQDFIIEDECCQENYYKNLLRLARQNLNNIRSISIENKEQFSLQEILDLFEHSDLSKIQKIHYSGECNDMQSQIIRLLSGSMKCASVNSGKWQGDVFRDRRSVLSSTLCRTFQNLHRLDSIYIYCFEMSHDILVEFFSCLNKRKSMKEIILFRLFCTDCGKSCDGFSLDLSQHSYIRTLGIEDIPLSQLDISVSSLEHCVLGPLSKPGVVSTFLSSLPAASKLHTLCCRYLQSPGDVETLVQTLPLLVQVKDVTLFGIKLGDRYLKLSPEKVNIEEVCLTHVTMSGSSLRDLVKLVEKIPHYVRVTVDECTVTPETEFDSIVKYIETSGIFTVTYYLRHGVFVFVKSAS